MKKNRETRDGIGGTSRFVASRFGRRVTGTDLTPELISIGQSLYKWVGLSGQVELHQWERSPNRDEYLLTVGAVP